MSNDRALRVIKWILIFNSVVFSIPTMVIGTIAVSAYPESQYLFPNCLQQTTSINPNLPSINLAWGRAELAVFFIQETALSILYIYKIKEYLSERAQLHQLIANTRNQEDANQDPFVLRQLIYANVFIIVLDIALLVIHCLGMFHLQGALKPSVYGIKLKIEFVVLNGLRDGVRRLASGRVWLGSGPETEIANGPPPPSSPPQNTQDEKESLLRETPSPSSIVD
jgi:hypothetical protein